jgi:hypothetical protein
LGKEKEGTSILKPFVDFKIITGGNMNGVPPHGCEDKSRENKWNPNVELHGLPSAFQSDKTQNKWQ